MAEELLLHVQRRFRFAQERAVGMAESMPSDAPRVLFVGQLATGIMDGDDVLLASATLNADTCHAGSSIAFRAGDEAPARTTNVVLLDRTRMVRVASNGARKQQVRSV